MAVVRIYSVSNEEEITLVKATTQSQALSHVVKNQFQVKIASAVDVVDYIGAGGVVEDATFNEPDAVKEEVPE